MAKTNAKHNKTLEFVVKMLNDCGVNDWCIMYGTLLGVIRDGGCIEGDDDVDIVIRYNYDSFRSLLESNGFVMDDKMINNIATRDSRTILKTIETEEYSSVDFYLLDNYKEWQYVPWHNTHIKELYLDADNRSYEEMKWASVTLQLPADPRQKLYHMYGDWHKPSGKHCPPDLYIQVKNAEFW